MSIFEDQETQSRNCYKFLSGSAEGNTTNLLKESYKWGFLVYELKHDIMTTSNNLQFTQKTMYQNEDCSEKKKSICLHFTGGGSAWWHITSLAIDKFYAYGYPICTPFWINRDGKVYQLYDPDYWAYNSSLATDENAQKVIGIEIANWGYLTEGDAHKKQDAAAVYTYTGNVYCYKTTKEHYYDLADKPLNGWAKTKYRNYQYFAKFTDEQYNSLRQLLHALCNHYNIKHEFLPEEHRFKHYSEGGFPYKDLSSLTTDFNGIFSHVNSDLGKWDIGPAFEWDRIVGTPVSHPLSDDREASGLWYFDTEKRERGGYYPIGVNHSIHNGFHLFAGGGTRAVKAIAPG
jgi:N-acetyl-anhydromuramyl-L-alanine amidase AmpD